MDYNLLNGATALTTYIQVTGGPIIGYVTRTPSRRYRALTFGVAPPKTLQTAMKREGIPLDHRLRSKADAIWRVKQHYEHTVKVPE